jgi:hypothetical protein
MPLSLKLDESRIVIKHRGLKDGRRGGKEVMGHWVRGTKDTTYCKRQYVGLSNVDDIVFEN